MKAIHWFRNDLRLEDNQSLLKCVAANEEMIPVYIFDPRHFEKTILGFQKSGFFRSQFLLQSIADLRKNLQAKGSDLIIRQGHPEQILPQLANEVNASNVYYSKEATTEEIIIEEKLEKALWREGKKLVPTWQSTLYHEEDIPWPIKHLPEIFTDFRKEAEKESHVRPTITAPKALPSVNIEAGQIPNLEDLNIEKKSEDGRTAYPFKGGETEALNRLNHYLFETDKIAKYKETRNGLIGTEYSTKFSAWLSLGCISPRTIYEEVRHYEKERKKNQSTYWVIFELMWRDYFRFIAKKHGTNIFKLEGIKKTDPSLSNDWDLFNKWAKGTIGQPFIDANMTELNQTGFMSNRGRQNAASYLVNDLGVNWTWGASYFESMLVDYDPCSNWGNWCYVAGVGNDPRKDRYFNPEIQAERYDPKGTFVELWMKESIPRVQ